MKKSFRAFALLLCAVLAAAFFAGCTLVEVDDSEDLNQTVATVNGEKITRSEERRVGKEISSPCTIITPSFTIITAMTSRPTRKTTTSSRKTC